MSILFPKVAKPRKWDYRPIYYDKEKEVRKDKLAHLRFRKTIEEHVEKRTSLHKNKSSKLVLWITILLFLLFLLYILN